MCFDSSTKSDQLRTIETPLSYVHGQWCSQYHGATIGDSPGHQTIRNSSSAFIILKILNIEERTTVRTANTSEMGVLRHALHHISVNEPPQLFTTRSIVFLINSVGLLPGFIETLIDVNHGLHREAAMARRTWCSSPLSTALATDSA